MCSGLATSLRATLAARMSEADIRGGVSGSGYRFAHPGYELNMTSRSRDALRPRFASTFVSLEIRGRREDRVFAATAPQHGPGDLLSDKSDRAL
jgi:hypothetical protein